MSDVVLLDAGPLGLITNPKASQENYECNLWMQSQLRKGVRVLVPEIADYEIRRELLRVGKIKGLARLDELQKQIGYIALSTGVMRQAADFWAQARKMGKPTAKDAALDGDVILAAQAATLSHTGHAVIVATTNVQHLSLFVDARLWRDI